MDPTPIQVIGFLLNLIMQYFLWRYIYVYYKLLGDKNRFYESGIVATILIVLWSLFIYYLLYEIGKESRQVNLLIVVIFSYFSISYYLKWKKSDRLSDPFDIFRSNTRVSDIKNDSNLKKSIPDEVDKLERLAKLKERGLLTDQEFEIEKKKIISD